MKYFMTCLLLSLAFVSTANAATCVDQIRHISGLDEVTKQSMIVTCETTKLEAQQSSVVTAMGTDEKIEMAEKWAEVAKQFVGAMALVAEEMGKTVNEFLPTPAGILTASLITWQVMGDSITSGLSKVLQAAVAILFMFIVYRYTKAMRHCETKEVTLKGFRGEKLAKYKVYTPVAKLSGDRQGWFHVIYVVGTLIGMLMLYYAF
jgi:hypothetical protein